VVKTAESMAIEVVRELILASQIEGLARVTVTVADEVATYLNNKKRRELSRLEDDSSITVQVFGDESAAPEDLVIECHDANGGEIMFPAG
jgi:ribonuclease E